MALSKEQLRTLLRKNPVGVACVVLCLALGLFAYLRSDAIPQAEEALVTNSSLVARLSQNLNNSTHLKDQYEQLLEAKGLIDPRLVRPAAIAENQRYFYRLEAATGAKLIDLRQTPSETAPSDGTFYKTVNFTVSLQGDFVRHLAFLRALEGGAYFSRINAVSIVPAGQASQDSQSGLLTMSINLDLVGVP